jgi:hypothetical protein
MPIAASDDRPPWEEDTLAVDLMLDSGAYSAWSRNDDALSVKKYIRYIRDNERYLFSYVNMDQIPGVYGQRRTQEQVEQSAAVGYRNLQVMKDAGLKPVPVFHQGERMHWLEKMLKDGEQYIGLSSIKESNSPEQRAWLDTIFSAITDSKGHPIIRTHGFGIANPVLLFRYPWYTVDATTWSMTPGFGQIIVPAYVGGRPDYLMTPKRIVVSGVQHKSTSSNKKQFEGMGPANRKAIEHFLNEEVGVSVIDARYDTGARRRAVIVYYLKLVDQLQGTTFKGRATSWNTALSHIDGKKGLTGMRLRMMFATALNRQWSQELNDTGARTRLMSYYELRKRSSEVLAEYVERGIIGKAYVKGRQRRNWANEGYLNWRRLSLVKRLEQGAPNGEEATTGKA